VAARIASRDETLLELFPDSTTEIVARDGNRRTTRTRYQALGKEGVATFHFDLSPDGAIGFEKVCDGNVWQELVGTVSFRGHGRGTEVMLRMDGRTKAFIPEFAIRGEMQNQIEQMASALRACIEAGDGD
jgi:hypothetical protein